MSRSCRNAMRSVWACAEARVTASTAAASRGRRIARCLLGVKPLWLGTVCAARRAGWQAADRNPPLGSLVPAPRLKQAGQYPCRARSEDAMSQSPRKPDQVAWRGEPARDFMTYLLIRLAWAALSTHFAED